MDAWRLPGRSSRAPGGTGAPFTADDIAFTVQVGQDRDLVQLGSAAYATVEGVEVVDPQTAVVKWQRPFIDADTLFSTTVAVPLPKHVLEPAYREDKARFLELPFWTIEYVGSGPFKLKEFARDSHVILEAFDDYVLGRPKLDIVEVRFIPDGNTLAANVLAGSVEMTIGRGLSLEQGLQIRDAWPDGRMDAVSSNGIFLWPQLLGPSPPITGDVRFRRALVQATDLKEITNVLTFGLGTPLESIIKPMDPEYRDVEANIVRYPFDANRAADMIGALGYTRGSDGLFHGAAGETIAIEVRTLAADLNQKTTLSVIDYWRRAGVDANLQTIPPQRQGDGEYRSTFPGWQILLGNPQPNSLHSSRAQLAQNNFQTLGGSGNYPRYLDPAYDALSDRYYATIPRPERMEVLRQIVRFQSDQVLVVPLFQFVQPAMVSNRFKNVTGGDSSNAHEWDVAQ
jgi:peptide/nickel transport system substrate-binding protein